MEYQTEHLYISARVSRMITIHHFFLNDAKRKNKLAEVRAQKDRQSELRGESKKKMTKMTTHHGLEWKYGKCSDKKGKK